MKKKIRDVLIFYMVLPLFLTGFIWFPLGMNYLLWTEMKNEHHIKEGYWEFFGHNWYKRPTHVSWDYEKEYNERQKRAAE
ncbi:hypothetical protein [Paenibacillus maysiensis]|uniref:hypothetical protein n=1 Tax=Paenibacillus maysiensis TaxID=1155954 RepID=UPI000472AAB4|nr:hypothetical protein [Paenibacillus maysiensis]